jgi:hypothetical protein
MFCQHLLVYINSKVPFHENLPPLAFTSFRRPWLFSSQKCGNTWNHWNKRSLEPSRWILHLKFFRYEISRIFHNWFAMCGFGYYFTSWKCTYFVRLIMHILAYCIPPQILSLWNFHIYFATDSQCVESGIILHHENAHILCETLWNFRSFGIQSLIFW